METSNKEAPSDNIMEASDKQESGDGIMNISIKEVFSLKGMEVTNEEIIQNSGCSSTDTVEQSSPEEVDHSSVSDFNDLGIDITEMKCPGCKKDFAKITGLKRHMIFVCDSVLKMNNDVLLLRKKLRCEKCAMIFASSSGLSEHRSTCENESTTLKCSICDEPCESEQELSSHMTSVHMNGLQILPSTCGKCQQVFSKEAELYAHTLISHLELPCLMCDDSHTFKGYSHLRDHYKYKHKGQNSIISFQCDLCDYECATDIVKNKPSVLKDRMKEHRMTHSPKVYHCHLCSSKFSQSQKLKAHLKNHSDTRSHLCPVCGKSFKSALTLKKHATVHSEVHEYQCTVCDETFKRPGALGHHMETHTNSSDHYSCKICGKAYNQRKNYWRHMRDHTKVKCEICDKLFTKSNISVHKRLHSGNKPANKYLCDICGKAFPDTQNLEVHMRSHTGERPHVCQTCGKAFKQIHHLQNHMRVHTGERPYKCEQCGKAFITIGNKINHMKTHKK